MIVKPIFRPHIRPVVVAGTGVFLLAEKGRRLLQGRLCEVLVPLVDGRRTADEIVEALRGDFPAAHIYYVLLMLEHKGYVTEFHRQVPIVNANFWSLNGVDSRRIKNKLGATRLVIKSLSKAADREPLTKALAAVGLRTADTGEMMIVLVDDYLDPHLEETNAAAIATGQPWAVVRPTRSTPWIGPLFSPGKTGCWECLASRLRSHRDLDRLLFQADEFSVPECDTPLTRQIACNILAMEILKWMGSEEKCGISGTLLSLDTTNWRTEMHRLIQHPECPACGVRSPRDGPVPIELEHRRIKFMADGGYRCSSPEETLERYAHHVSPITGVVRALNRHTHATDATKVYLAVDSRPISERPHKIPSSEYSVGKGMTETQAKASALCEALERYSGAYRGNEPAVVSSFTAIGDKAIHPNACMLYSDQQYRLRDEINAAGSRFNRIPKPFDENADVSWSSVWSLSHKEFRFVPTSYCYFGYKNHSDRSGDVELCYPCSNGNAAGNTLEEAILQGLFELVERDGVAIWWYNSLPRPGVELTTFSEGYFDEIREHYSQAGRELWVIDLTTDLEIPTFAAISSKLNGNGPVLLGFGCHLDARLAVARALTEMNQMLISVISAETDPASSSFGIDNEMATWMKTVSIRNQPCVLPNPAATPRTAGHYRQWHHLDICEVVLECQANLLRHGLEILVLDQTRSEIGLPVVKVIVPGLRHFWPRFAPGRLYDVPVRMGWLAAPHKEEELNPISLCF